METHEKNILIVINTICETSGQESGIDMKIEKPVSQHAAKYFPRANDVAIFCIYKQ
ncbi:MAG: hypothetical protein VB032_03775 [Burkholderiaceae bacterium]|nr:hypothetical protein [Burkholderiaceae bacterium]